MVKKTSAHYQREFRRRLRELGLIKKRGLDIAGAR